MSCKRCKGGEPIEISKATYDRLAQLRRTPRECMCRVVERVSDYVQLDKLAESRRHD